MITSPAPDLDRDAVDTGISTGVTAGAGAETGAQVCDVIDGDTTRLDDLIALFVEHFPRRAASAEQLRRNALAEDECPRFRAHQYLVDVGGQPAGMICFCYSPHHDMGLLEWLAVRADRRSQIVDGCRLPEWLIRQAVAQLRRDAARAMRPMPACLCAEVEPAPLVRRFCEFGFIEFPVAYRAPVFDGPRDASGPIRQPATRFEPRHLGAFPADPNLALLKTPAWVTPRLVVDAMLMVCLDYYRLSDTHPAVRQALLSIRDLHPRDAARRA
jgi:hypothetical protein